MKDINLYSTKELLEELMLRFDHCIFAALECRDKETIRTIRRFKGNSDTCIGLAHKLQNFINADWESKEKATPENFED